MKKAYVIGIAGGSAGGKSTFAKMLQTALEGLEVRILSMDTYFKAEEERLIVEAPITGSEYRDDNHPSSFNLNELKRDLANILSDGQIRVVIVEGLLTLWDNEILEQLDLRLFVDCRADERIVRRLKRNMQWGLTFDQIAEVYLDLVRYRHDEYVEPSKWRADFIINGSNPSDKALQILANHIKCSME
ncbi:MAG: hypothetical protein J1E34_05525 [Oscillospiraceae bacterium]|nr:hypothetical protein [Oscillospiraceae bacterium]